MGTAGRVDLWHQAYDFMPFVNDWPQKQMAVGRFGVAIQIRGGPAALRGQPRQIRGHRRFARAAFTAGNRDF